MPGSGSDARMSQSQNNLAFEKPKLGNLPVRQVGDVATLVHMRSWDCFGVGKYVRVCYKNSNAFSFTQVTLPMIGATKL